MKRVYIIVLAVIVAVSLFSLAIFTDLSNPVLDSPIPIVMPYYKSLLNNAINIVNNNQDFLLAILGTDERENEKSRSDVIMLLKYKAKENKVIVVSVPRDSKVSIFDRGMTKINAASAYGGCRLQVKVLENLFKVNSVRYVHINFEGFRKIIDTIGGVEINAEKDFARDWGEKDTYAKKGKNLLLGNDLLEYVRFRHDEEGDFGRIKRQQEVLFSLASSIIKSDNIGKLPEIALIVAKSSASDMDIFFIMRNLKKLKNLDSLEFEFYTLKTYSEKSNGIWYEIIDEDQLKYISDLLQ